MTGGTLPALTWHEIMVFAHQNLDAEAALRRPAAAGARGERRSPAPPQAPTDGGGAPASATLSLKAAKAVRDVADLASAALKGRQTAELAPASLARGGVSP